MTDCEFTVNSARTLADAHKWLDDNFKTEGFTRYKCRHGSSATVPMNRLMHAWLTEFAAHLAGCDACEVGEENLDGLKRSMKRCCYLETSEKYLVYRITCPLTQKSKLELTSSAKWDKASKSHFLTWLQAFAATKGLLLESKGEFAELKKAQHE